MPAEYQRELDLTVAILRQMRLPVHLLHPGDPVEGLDAGLRRLLGMQEDYAAAYHMARQWSHRQTIYKIVDPFMCSYIYFLLPMAQPETAVVIGPYLTAVPSRSMLLEQAEGLHIDSHHTQQMEEFYAALPILHDTSALWAIISCLGEVLWGGPEAFRMVDVNDDQLRSLPSRQHADAPIEQDNILRQMEQLDLRYAYEDQLMEIVSKGLTQRAEQLLSSVSELNFQNRTPDPLRNIKNYCIICNTLLRKAAQRGGVHPLYLDRLSGQYARRIEAVPTVRQAHALIGEMIRSYCRLVHSHAGQQYPAIVQKTMAYIDANLSGDLSLATLSSLMQVTPGYLSTLFHREIGATLAEHITAQRMRAALHLLNSTHLQVQNIAQLSGYSDPNYFGKAFKRFYGLTPQQYRHQQRNSPSPLEE